MNSRIVNVHLQLPAGPINNVLLNCTEVADQVKKKVINGVARTILSIHLGMFDLKENIFYCNMF